MKKIKFGNFTYLLEGNNECYCTGVSDKRKRYRGILSIPESIYYDGKTYTVTEICSDSFREAKIESISFPSSIRSIGSFCFIECNYLTDIVIPDTIKCIGYRSFSNCDNLKTVIFNDTTEILPNAFINTPYYRNIFSNCKDDECVYLGSNLINIGDNCKTVITKPGTKAIIIPARRPLTVENLILTNTIECIELSRFITVENIYVDSIESYFNINITVDLMRPGIMRNLYVDNKLVENLIVPSEVRSISKSHISGLSINAINISSQLRRIDYNCFVGCKNLKSIALLGYTYFNSGTLSESGINEITINQSCRFSSETLYSSLDIIIRLDEPIKIENLFLFENINQSFNGGVVKPNIILLLIDDSPKTIESIIEALSKSRSDLKNLVIHLPDEMLYADYRALETKFYLDFRVPDHLLSEFSKVFPRSIKYSSIGYKGCSEGLEYYLDGDKTIIVPKLNENDENQYKGIIKIPNTLKNVELYPFAFANCKELNEVICSDDIKITENTFLNSGKVKITRIKTPDINT